MDALKWAKCQSLSLARRGGLFGVCSQSAWRRNRLLILCYHGISLEDEHEWDPQLYMRQSVFVARMEVLRRQRCNVLSLSEGLRRLADGTLPDRSVCITFDDGMRDFLYGAVPVLQRFGYPATLYVTTYFTEREEPVFPLICSYVLWRGGVELEERRKVVQQIERENLGDRERVTADLASRFDVDYEQIRRRRVLWLMQRDELRSAAAAGVDLQLHTHRHRVPLRNDLFRAELRENAERIESLTGRIPTHFCYPGGAWRPDVLPWLEGAGVESATTCRAGLAGSSSDPLLLPRLVDTSGITEIEFESWISGIGALLPIRHSQ